jgi:hypothetical protein
MPEINQANIADVNGKCSSSSNRFGVRKEAIFFSLVLLFRIFRFPFKYLALSVILTTVRRRPCNEIINSLILANIYERYDYFIALKPVNASFFYQKVLDPTS